jgi:quercetin dioxygenase-like cupin family protein
MPQRSEHTYLRTHEMSGQLLRFRLAAEESRLREQAAASKAGRAAKTLVKEGSLRITQVALRKGTPLQAHQVAGAVSLQVQRGRLRLTTAGGALDLGSGELVALGAGVAHAALALSDCVILITMAMQ